MTALCRWTFLAFVVSVSLARAAAPAPATQLSAERDANDSLVAGIVHIRAF